MIVAGYANRDPIKLKIASVYVPVPPKAAQADLATRRREHALGVAAPWVLSALPECLRQTFEGFGSHAYVSSLLPSGYAIQPSGTQLQFGDCSVVAREKDVLVRRGQDRFYVPAPAQLFKKGSSIALMHEAGARVTLRIYEPAPPSL